MGSSPGVTLAIGAVPLPAGLAPRSAATAAPLAASWTGCAARAGGCGLDASARAGGTPVALGLAGAGGDCATGAGRPELRHAGDLVLQVDGLGHQPHLLGRHGDHDLLHRHGASGRALGER